MTMKTTTVKRQYGAFVLTADYFKSDGEYDGSDGRKWAVLRVDSLASGKMVWASTMSWEQAGAAITIFEECGADGITRIDAAWREL